MLAALLKAVLHWGIEQDLAGWDDLRKRCAGEVQRRWHP
jgi:hypothetical protein